MIRRRSRAWSVAAALAVVAALPAVAQANVVSDYPPSSDARTFGSSAAGWGSTSKIGGLCIPVVNCPLVQNVYRPSGGAAGAADGFIRTSLASIAGAAAESEGVWTSPAFTYNGAAGKAADRLVFSFRLRAEVGPLLNVAGNGVDYTVQILGGESGENVAIAAVEEQALDPTDGWVAIPPIELSAGDLNLGGTYRIRITTRFANSTEVIPGGDVDYDNVRLRAVDEPTIREIRNQVVSVLPGSATLGGNRIFVKMRCPSGVPKQCRYALVGLVRRGGARLTLPRYARVAPGGQKTLGLSVRQGFQRQVATKRNVLFRIRGRVGATTITVFKKMTLVQR
jgi:hypothetical protein